MRAQLSQHFRESTALYFSLLVICNFSANSQLLDILDQRLSNLVQFCIIVNCCFSEIKKTPYFKVTTKLPLIFFCLITNQLVENLSRLPFQQFRCRRVQLLTISDKIIFAVRAFPLQCHQTLCSAVKDDQFDIKQRGL